MADKPPFVNVPELIRVHERALRLAVESAVQNLRAATGLSVVRVDINIIDASTFDQQASMVGRCKLHVSLLED